MCQKKTINTQGYEYQPTSVVVTVAIQFNGPADENPAHVIFNPPFIKSSE